MAKWKLPSIYIPNPYTFEPIVYLGGVIPFGYKIDPNDKDVLLPIEKELQALERAKKLIKEYPIYAVADWLSKETGRKISKEGLRQRIRLEQRRRQQVTMAQFYAEKYKKAKEKAEELEKRLGAKDPKRKTRSNSEGSSFKTCRT